MSFNLTRALCGRSLTIKQIQSCLGGSQAAVFSTSANRNVNIRVVPAPPADARSYEEKNLALKRELSPHLLIYKPQLTSMLSITHRITGMTLSGLATVLAINALVSPTDFSYVITAVEGLQLSTPTLAFIKFYIALPATYHTCNGVRHLLWDNGKFLKLNEVYTTGYIMLGLAVALAAVLTAL